jgi:hypothetical protein
MSFVAAAPIVAACGGESVPTDSSPASAPAPPAATAAPATGDEKFPDVVSATARRDGDTWTFNVTVSSPYDTPERYADGWRVLGPDGTVYGEHKLAHDHQNEQPFTRTQSGVMIPGDIGSVMIEGRDQVSGYGGRRAFVDLTK